MTDLPYAHNRAEHEPAGVDDTTKGRQRRKRRNPVGPLLVIVIIVCVIAALYLRGCQDIGGSKSAGGPTSTDPTTVPVPDKSRRVNDADQRMSIDAPIDWYAFFEHVDDGKFGQRVLFVDGGGAGQEYFNYIANPAASTASAADVKTLVAGMVGGNDVADVSTNKLIAAQSSYQENGNTFFIRCWAHDSPKTQGAAVTATGYWCLRMYRKDYKVEDFNVYANTIQFIK